jgi:secreted trypsin-like serine protease
MQMIIRSFWLKASLVLATVLDSGSAYVHHVRASPRIVIGEFVDRSTVPFYATLYVDFSDDAGTSICGCVLIGNQTVLTAAHCLVRTDEKNAAIVQYAKAMSVRLYGKIRNRVGESLRVDVNSAAVHPLYRGDTLVDDVASFRIPELANLDRDLGVLVNFDRERWETLTEWDKLAVVGVGLDRSGATYSLGGPPKQTYLSRRNCLIPGNGPGHLLGWHLAAVQNDICAGPFNVCDNSGRCQDSCGGDSGGPLFQRLDDNSIVLYGVVSRGFALIHQEPPRVICGLSGDRGGHPGIYTPTDLHKFFIRNFTASIMSLEPRVLSSSGLCMRVAWTHIVLAFLFVLHTSH